VCWCAGSNLFSSWREEDEETWRHNEEKLQNFRIVYDNIEDDLDLISTEDALQAAGNRLSETAPDDFDDFPF
jgi:hypothetical protein